MRYQYFNQTLSMSKQLCRKECWRLLQSYVTGQQYLQHSMWCLMRVWSLFSGHRKRTHTSTNIYCQVRQVLQSFCVGLVDGCSACSKREFVQVNQHAAAHSPHIVWIPIDKCHRSGSNPLARAHTKPAHRPQRSSAIYTRASTVTVILCKRWSAAMPMRSGSATIVWTS